MFSDVARAPLDDTNAALYAKRSKGARMRYRADTRTVGFILAYFVALGVAWSFPLRRPLIVALLVAGLCWLSWINAVITHNVVHTPIWRSRAMNRATKVLLSLTYGFAVSDFVPGHNLSHHRYTQTRRDVMRTPKVRGSATAAVMGVPALKLVMYS